MEHPMENMDTVEVTDSNVIDATKTTRSHNKKRPDKNIITDYLCKRYPDCNVITICQMIITWKKNLE